MCGSDEFVYINIQVHLLLIATKTEDIKRIKKNKKLKKRELGAVHSHLRVCVYVYIYIQAFL